MLCSRPRKNLVGVQRFPVSSEEPLVSLRAGATGDVMQNVVRGVVNIHQQGAIYPAELKEGDLCVSRMPDGQG